MAAKIVHTKLKLNPISDARVLQLQLAMETSSEKIIEMAITEFWQKNHAKVESYRRQLDAGSAFDVPTGIAEPEASPKNGENSLPE